MGALTSLVFKEAINAAWDEGVNIGVLQRRDQKSDIVARGIMAKFVGEDSTSITVDVFFDFQMRQEPWDAREDVWLRMQYLRRHNQWRRIGGNDIDLD